MRARRHQIAFDCLDIRLVLDSGVGGAVGTSAAVALVAPAPIYTYNSTITDPGLLGGGGGDGGDSASGGATITDPGLMN